MPSWLNDHFGLGHHRPPPSIPGKGRGRKGNQGGSKGDGSGGSKGAGASGKKGKGKGKGKARDSLPRSARERAEVVANEITDDVSKAVQLSLIFSPHRNS